MTMHINLSPEMERFIKDKVASGFYGNATEVIRDAIRRMQDEEVKLNAFKAAIAKGEASLDRGEGIPYSRALMRAISQEVSQGNWDNEARDPDVLP